MERNTPTPVGYFVEEGHRYMDLGIAPPLLRRTDGVVIRTSPRPRACLRRALPDDDVLVVDCHADAVLDDVHFHIMTATIFRWLASC